MATAAIVSIPSFLIGGAIVAVLLASLLLVKEMMVVHSGGKAMKHALLNGALLALGAVFMYDIGKMLLP